MSTCQRDVDMFTRGRIVLSLPKRAHVGYQISKNRHVRKNAVGLLWELQAPSNALLVTVVVDCVKRVPIPVKNDDDPPLWLAENLTTHTPYQGLKRWSTTPSLLRPPPFLCIIFTGVLVDTSPTLKKKTIIIVCIIHMCYLCCQISFCVQRLLLDNMQIRDAERLNLAVYLFLLITGEFYLKPGLNDNTGKQNGKRRKNCTGIW